MYIYTFIYTYMYIYIYVCIYAYIYTYIYELCSLIMKHLGGGPKPNVYMYGQTVCGQRMADEWRTAGGGRTTDGRQTAERKRMDGRQQPDGRRKVDRWRTIGGRLLCDKADMFAVSQSRHACCVTQATGSSENKGRSVILVRWIPSCFAYREKR